MSMIQLIHEHLKDLLPGLLGIEFVEANTEEVIAKLLVRKNLCTIGGILHGGALMAFADTLGAVGAFLNLPEGASTTTVESKTNFTAPAREGTTITGRSVVLHKGKTLMLWQTEITDDSGKLIGLVTQSQMILGGT